MLQRGGCAGFLCSGQETEAISVVVDLKGQCLREEMTVCGGRGGVLSARSHLPQKNYSVPCGRMKITLEGVCHVEATKAGLQKHQSSQIFCAHRLTSPTFSRWRGQSQDSPGEKPLEDRKKQHTISPMP